MPFLKGIIGIIQMISKTDFIGAMVLRECGSKLIHVKSRIVCLAYGRSRCVHRRSEGACLYTATKRAGICMDCPKNNWQIHSNYKTNKCWHFTCYFTVCSRCGLCGVSITERDISRGGCSTTLGLGPSPAYYY